MTRHFPYVAAVVATVAAGAVGSIVARPPTAEGAGETVARAAQLPVAHPGFAAHPVGAVAMPRPVAPPISAAAAAANVANTPGSTPTVPPGSAPQTFAPGNVGLIQGPPGNPATALPPGLTPYSAYQRTDMNQPGQPPFGENLYSMQTYMNQPGVSDYYERLGYNPTVLMANEGITPSASYPNPSGPQTGVPSYAVQALGASQANGDNVGFYQGFGPGQPNVGFYAGLSAPR